MDGQSSGFLQTPQFFLFKESRALSQIGSHILVAALYKDGVALGMRYHDRRNTKYQWISPMSPYLLMAGWGDLMDFETVRQKVELAKQGLINLVGEYYVSLPFLAKIVGSLLKEKFELTMPFSLDTLIIDTVHSVMIMINFAGEATPLRGFGVLGGYAFANEKISSDASIEKIQKSGAIEFPVKKAIQFMEKKYRDRDFLSTKNEAIGVVKETLFKFDPVSKKEMFAIFNYSHKEDLVEPEIISRKNLMKPEKRSKAGQSLAKK